MTDPMADLDAAETLVEVGDVVRLEARRRSGSQGATFVLREHDRCFYADEDAIAPLWKGQRFPITSCVSGWAMLHDEIAVVPDIAVDERIPLEAYTPTFVRSLVMVPVGSPTPVAAIGAYWSRRYHASPEQIDGLQTLADHAAKAIHRIGLDDAPWAPTFSKH
ncbi:GAF domain-containing protein [Kribbella pittospori]|uniref:GAF domain-containing protein n=1 Tax=Kribbella pittospori TaxID=722689 RepID=A0A4R0KZP4_9ACTN|nr:GAF domain-containing protein [Kribbella pittospori]TCC66249.1 GAF domain-containing protein [Kribbella pittospori]